jgi:hypothetical protein
MIPLIGGYVMGRRTAAKIAVLSAGSGSAGSIEALAEVDARVDRLLLVIEAMWSILKDDGHTDEELAARIAEIDKSDGSVDGRKSLAPVTCKSCGSKVMAGLPRCQTCGTETGVVAGPLDAI